MSDTPPFPWSRETVEGERTIFNLTPVDSSLEARFAEFLDRATDVAAWAKLTMNSRFALEYISKAGALRYYYPDFVLRLADDTLPDRRDQGPGGPRRRAQGPPRPTLVQGRHTPLRARLGLREGPPEAVRQVQRRQHRGPAPVLGRERRG